MRAEDFVVFRVSTTSDTGRNTPRRFLSSEKKQLLLPPEMSAFHLQYTDYYFPEGVDFPGRVPQIHRYSVCIYIYIYIYIYILYIYIYIYYIYYIYIYIYYIYI